MLRKESATNSTNNGLNLSNKGFGKKLKKEIHDSSSIAKKKAILKNCAISMNRLDISLIWYNFSMRYLQQLFHGNKRAKTLFNKYTKNRKDVIPLS